jgi:hypothetical protein
LSRSVSASVSAIWKAGSSKPYGVERARGCPAGRPDPWE